MAELTFRCSAGALIRGQVRRSIKSYCHQRGYILFIDEDKGLFESLFNITITLPDSQLQRAMIDFNNWAERTKS
jgi:hypothetical protein